MMKKNMLFPQLKGLVHGGDYNPDQWLDRPDILEQDVKLMKEAGINCVSLGIFSWSVYEPVEGEYHFEWLEKIMDNLYENGIYTILSTPSGARPAWMDQKYPEVMRVDAYGQRNHHGIRENHCMTSLKYRQMVGKMDGLLAEKFAHHPGLLMWHISNEFGGYCYCDACKKKFQTYLSDKFGGDIEKLNKAWWTGFWSHKFNDFTQIEPPYSNGENSIMGLDLEWKNFSTWNTDDFMRFEIDTVKKYNPDIPATTNFMTLFEELDYHAMMDSVDVISWDSYPYFHNNRESLQETFLFNAFNHGLFRSMKQDRPFMMMESAPGLANWHPFNKYKRPGIHRLACMQAVACGSDTVQYFQIRKGRGAFEQHHGAVIDHMGTNDTRVFKEVAEVGELLQQISEVAGTLADNKIALLFDWDNWWSITDTRALADETKKFDATCVGIWNEFVKLGLEPDIISSDMDWSGYQLILAPMLYVLHDGIGEKIADYVSKGGRILSTYFTGYVDQNQLCYLGGFPGDGLKDVFGIVSEEIDTLYPEDKNSITWKKDGHHTEVKDYTELLRVGSAQVLASYDEDYIEGTAAVTCNEFGEGKAWYVACRMKPEDMVDLFKDVLTDTGIAWKELPEGLEYHARYDETSQYEFYLNMNTEPVTLCLDAVENVITKENLQGDYEIPKYQVLVTKRPLA